MGESPFGKFYWGFLFIMVDFKIQGFDILPDILGYIFFAFGLGILAEKSINFEKAHNLNIPMIILSIFSIYEQPAKSPGIHLGYLGIFGLIIGIIGTIISILVVYYLFMGIKDLSEMQGKNEIYDEAERRWTQFLLLQIAVLFAFVLLAIPPMALLYIIALFVVSIALTIVIMQFMRRCDESLSIK